MEITSIITGKRGVSLPFTDYCEPIGSGTTQFPDMFKAAIAVGKKQNWKYLELRGGETFFQNVEPSEFYYGHALDLTQGPRTIFYNLRDSTRRHIKKAKKENLKTFITTSLESLNEFCRLNALTRKNHGLPPQPYPFFQSIYDHIISKKLGFIALIFSHNTAIAGNIYFHFGDEVIYKYGASDRTYQRLRANNLIIWEAIKWSYGRGYKRFFFGRTEPDNRGLRQFKAGWGTREYLIKYYKYDLQKDIFIKDNRKINPMGIKLLKLLPSPALALLGKVFYRHMG